MKRLAPFFLAFLIACSSASVAPPAPPPAMAEMAPTAPTAPAAPTWSYPPAPRSETFDDYHGTRVADPFRVLEDPADPASVAWVEAENKVTRSYMDSKPVRNELKLRLTELINYARMGVPYKEANRYFYSRNSGLQNQSIIYMRDGLKGEEKLVIDPNTLSADGTLALGGYTVSDDGKTLAYSLSQSGSDYQKIYIRNLDSGANYPESLEWLKFTSATWTPDNKGFYYSRLPVPGSVPAGDEHYFPKLYYHRVGTPQTADTFVYDVPDVKEITFGPQISHDGKWLIVTQSKGTAPESEVLVLDRTTKNAKWKKLYTGFEASYYPDEVIGDELFLFTDASASRGKVIAKNLKTMAERTVIPEGPDTLSQVSTAGGRLITQYLNNASSALRVYDTKGTMLREITLPGIGSAGGISSRPDDNEMFFAFNSYVYPPTIFRYDVASNQMEEFYRSPVKIDPTQFETKQLWYSSKDGTKVSMFVSHKKGVQLNGDNPTMLYGYGGFNSNQTPSFSAFNYAFLERGGVYAVANLRGGSEYGEEWHKSGMLEKKQNVFDDFIGAAEHLIAAGYTKSSRLAIRGGSNGGLLTAAVENQRPDLFGAVVTQVPVADMLRYHKFTVGRFWIPEYGSSENADQFKFLYAYSPLHNVKKGTKYPATLITTADTDDRVAPGHAKKLAATIQEAQGGNEPILIRIETKAGHGAGKPISKQIDEAADMWTFVFTELGMI